MTLAIVIILVLAGIGVGVYFLTKKKSSVPVVTPPVDTTAVQLNITIGKPKLKS